MQGDCRSRIGSRTRYFKFAILDSLRAFLTRCQPEDATLAGFEHSIRRSPPEIEIPPLRITSASRIHGSKGASTTMKTYMIHITSPAAPPGLFTLHIVPNGERGAIVRHSEYQDEEVLRQLLTQCLSKDIIVDDVIKMAREEGICDLRERAITLSDECAKTLGWIF